MVLVAFDLLIRNGTVVSSAAEQTCDIGIRDGKIVELGDLAHADAAETLDATGLHILPGFIDTQVHFREPGMEHKEDLESGTRSAVMGGVTTVFEMPNTSPPTISQQALDDKLERADGRAWCNYAFFVGAAAENVGELAALEQAHGAAGIKIFMGSSTGSLLVPDDETLRQVLLNGKRRCPVHAEDYYRLEQRKTLLSVDPHPREHPFLRDEECARQATERLIQLSKETRRPVHILHVSTAEELPLIRSAKALGLGTTAEVTPQHLFFQAPECYERLGTLAQMNPPVRDRRHQQALRKALQEGIFDVLGSDHAPHSLEEKQQPYPKSPSGMPGVQTLLPVMLTFVNQGLLTLRELVKLGAEGPANIYGIRDKGYLTAGYDADIVLIDLKKRQRVESSWLQSKCGWSPYEGEELQGWPIDVLCGGQTAVREATLHGRPGGRVVEFAWK